MAGDDALVLTPSLRVGEAPEVPAEDLAEDEPEIAGDEPAREAEDAPQPDEETALDASWEEVAGAEKPEASAPAVEERTPEALEARVAGLEAAFDEGESFEPDGSEVTDLAEDFEWEEDADDDTVIDLSTADVPAGRLHFTRIEPEETAEEPAEAIEAADEAAPVEESAAPQADDEPVLADAEWDGSADDLPEEAEAEEEWPEPEEDWSAPDLPRPDEAESEAEEMPESAPPLMFRRNRAALRAVEDVPEADDALEGYVIGTASRSDEIAAEGEDDPWDDETPADEADSALMDADFDEAALSAAVNDPRGPTLLDEARLADLVAEVVRDELRGRMGERITQNVRKLVRREIARALETRGIR
ncbi:hypothetical protein [Oceanicola sp. 502str15]|uniref:hypothetical protein n=1 Tax=Oceanicola sp. 502str15 TaxID=2696061 RepID=UPI0020962C1D|nr:hypothetical protein [Oceanicola sp. 502str15]MCO6383000.1 hypothetical protein [Oceanicola sp. 502str15]